MKFSDLLQRLAGLAKLPPGETNELRAKADMIEAVAMASRNIIRGPTLIEGATIKAGWGNVVIDDNGVRLYDGATLTGHLQIDGDWFVGADISSADTTSLSEFSVAQTYNGESMGAGDIMLGSNSSGYANILWDASEKRFDYRSGTSTNAYLAADTGALHFVNNESGIIFDGTTSAENASVTQDDDDNLVFTVPKTTGMVVIRNDSYNRQRIASYGTDGMLGLYGASNTTECAQIFISGKDIDGESAGAYINMLVGTDSSNGSAPGTFSIFNLAIDDGKQVFSYTNVGDNDSWTINVVTLEFLCSSGMRLNEAGAYVTEFSTDGTFADNSDAALPTEKAIKTYVAAQKLSGFSATTSAELAGVISDETGTGALVFGTAPNFTGPVQIAGGGTARSGLEISGASPLNQLWVTGTASLGASSGGSMLGFAEGIPSAADQRLGFFAFGAQTVDADTVAFGASVEGFSDEAWSSGVAGTYCLIKTTPTGSQGRAEAIRFTSAQMVNVAKGLYVGNSSGTATDDDIICDGTIKTAAGCEYDLGDYTAGAPTPTGYLTFTKDGSTYRVAVEAV